MKAVLISIIMLTISFTAKSQSTNPDLLIQKWNVKQVNIAGNWQKIQLKNEESGPYLWLKKGGEAEMLYMDVSTGQWKYNDKTSTLTLIEKQVTTDYLVESITKEKLSLKVLGRVGSMDPAFILLEAADTNSKN